MSLCGEASVVTGIPQNGWTVRAESREGRLAGFATESAGANRRGHKNSFTKRLTMSDLPNASRGRGAVGFQSADQLPTLRRCLTLFGSAYFPSASWTMIKKLRAGILASPVSNSTWTESLPTKSLLGW
jgi:hypothetical protein